MKVLLVEDDILIVELIQSIILSLNPTTKIVCAHNSQDAINCFCKEKPQLVLCDWHLEGLDTSKALLQHLNHTQENVQVLIITAQATRDLVLHARKLGVAQFLVKPFTPEALASRLQPFLTATTNSEAPENVSVKDWLILQAKAVERLPNLATASDLIGQLNNSKELSPQELAAKCHRHVNLTERLIRVANNAEMRRTGKPIDTVSAAIATMGVDMTIAQIAAITLSQAGETLEDPQVFSHARRVNERSVNLAELSAKLAHAANADPRLCFNAGLLAFIGELAVLSALDDYSKQKVALTDTSINDALEEFSAIFGNHLKQHWRLPMRLRQTIGAVHKLSTMSCDKNQYIMNLAGNMESAPDNTEVLIKLSHLAGLPEPLTLKVAAEYRSRSKKR